MQSVTTSLTVIEIRWDGPYSTDQIIKTASAGTDYGIYQLYGTHNVLGPDSLLYIGKSEADTFSQRISWHEKEWIDWEAAPVQVYLGRLGGLGKAKKGKGEWKDWEDQISRAERLLIYFCAPPYNSQGLKAYGEMPQTIVLNYHRRHRLPPEVSTFYEASEYATKRTDWNSWSTE